MRIGAHVSTAGGLPKAIDRALDIGAEALQCFCSSPQGWAFKPLPQAQTAAFRARAAETGVGPNFLHAIYLINLSAPTPENLQKSMDSLVNYMGVASAMGAAGVIFHGGSHRGAGYNGIFRQVVDSLLQVLERSPSDVLLCLENSAGMGNHIGSKFEEVGRILRAVGHPRMKVCLDTQHCFAAGYNVATKDGLDAAMQEFDREVGLGNLAALHANDSKQALASGVDRHDNIGEGQIGRDGFLNILRHPAFHDLPFFLEVPGFENTGPDKRNVDILKELRAQTGV
ncbi:MAG: deoxyribonuclease IV [Chloroflexi bacterium]|nr:deoxyribonuclease IV [Chloroflexota bacterium]